MRYVFGSTIRFCKLLIVYGEPGVIEEEVARATRVVWVVLRRVDCGDLLKSAVGTN